MTAGVVPPNDLDAEAAVLSAVLLDPNALDRVSDTLAPEHFYSDANRRIFEAVLCVSTSGAPVDLISVASWLRDRNHLLSIGGPSYLADIADATPAVAHLENHAQIVLRCWRRREMIRSSQLVIAEAAQGDMGDFDEWVHEKEQAFHKLAMQSGKEEDGDLKSILSAVFKNLSDDNGSGPSFSSGLSGYDRLTGGMYPGDLIIVAARPGVGKTSLVGQISLNVASKGHAAAFFSLEMPKEQLATRFACLEGMVDLQKIRTRTMLPDDWQRLAASAARLSKLPLWIDDEAAISPLALRSRVRRLQSKYSREGIRLGLIVVDYVQLMTGRGLVEKSANREREVAAISQYLKRVAKEMKVPVIALSQLNRGVDSRDNKRPQLSDLRESGSLEQDADTVIFIYRDEYHHSETTREKGIAELIIAKQRNGPEGVVKVSFDGRYTRFANLDDNRYM